MNARELYVTTTAVTGNLIVPDLRRCPRREAVAAPRQPFPEVGRAEPPHHPDRFPDDAPRHLRDADAAVGEGDRDLDDPEAAPPREEVHLDLERVAVGTDTVQVDRLEHARRKHLKPPVASCSGRPVMIRV